MNSDRRNQGSIFRVPDGLVEHDQWVLWRYLLRDGRQAKVPFQITGTVASSTAPETWSPFESALNAWRRNQTGYAGLGFVFSGGDGLAGIDLDNALKPDGAPKEWARGIVERFADTYMEISPSGRGVKIWVRGSLPANLGGVRVGDGQIEMYDHARYFAVTGRAFLRAPLEIENHADDLVSLYERLTGSRKPARIEPLENGRIPYGRQHNTLVSLCGTLRARNVCEEGIEACLQAVNAHQCEKPGPRENISRIVRSTRGWHNNG
jgi:primase-polymerase (primpol)-like protein